MLKPFRMIVYHEVDGVRIPFASPLAMWKLKQTYREKDIPDRLFLRQLLSAQGIVLPDDLKSNDPRGLKDWLHRAFGRDI